jgi:hypothetical protein
MSKTDDKEKENIKLARVYLKIRDAVDKKEAAHKEEIKALKEQLDVVGNKLLEICKEQGADTIKTPAGTIMRSIHSRYWASDWESMHAFIRKHGALDLLERRIHNGNMQKFIEAHPKDYPAGLQLDRKFVVSVRKPKQKLTDQE